MCACHGIHSESVTGITLYCADLSSLKSAKPTSKTKAIVANHHRNVKLSEIRPSDGAKKMDDSVYDLTEHSTEAAPNTITPNATSSADSAKVRSYTVLHGIRYLRCVSVVLQKSNDRESKANQSAHSTPFPLEKFLIDLSEQRSNERRELEGAIQGLETRLRTAEKQNLLLKAELRNIKVIYPLFLPSFFRTPMFDRRR